MEALERPEAPPAAGSAPASALVVPPAKPEPAGPALSEAPAPGRRRRGPVTKASQVLDRIGARVVDSDLVGSWSWRFLNSRIGQALRKRLEAAQCRRLLAEIRKQSVPRHVAIIMDGNRRFARKLGLAPVVGHVLGRTKLEEVMRWCLDLDIKVLTVYAFSTENFNRDGDEVQLLMDLFADNYREMARHPDVHQHKIRIRTIGHRELLPAHVQAAAREAEEATKDYDGYFFNVAVAYGGRQEILKAIREVAEDVADGRLAPQAIDEELISSRLYTNGLPDPDLILRTSGEERISNFLLWQLAYSELYFADVHWPALRKKDFLRAILTYQRRERRYGSA